MTQPILNPVKLPADLFPAEVKFARCLAEGTLCTVGNGGLPEKEIEFGDNANVVRGEVVRFFAYGGDSDKYLVPGSVIDLRGAWIVGTLDLMHANILYALALIGCRFVGPVVMLHAGCDALYLNGSHLAKGLTADGITTKGGVNLRDGFSAEGEVRLPGANVGGDLFCEGGRFHNPKGNALNADRLTTQGDVNLRDGFSVEGGVQLLGANIGGNLSCAGGRFHNPKGKALSADRVTVKGGVFLSGGFSAEGEVRLPGANVGGGLSCEGGGFNNLEGCALNADGITTGGSVNLRDGFSAEGEVRLLGADVGGNLSCKDGWFRNPKGNPEGNPEGKALSADRVTVKGGVFLSDGFFAEGEVRLLGANVGGSLSCEGGWFHNLEGKALSAKKITVKGDVSLCDGFSAKGEVWLPDANVGGRLNCVGARFYNPEGYALNVEGAIIHSGFIWRKTSGGGKVELEYAKIGVLADDADSWKPFEVVLDGFTYNSFAGPVDAQFRLDWLGNRPQGMRFSPLPYEQAAKVLFGMGQAREAREILLEKERLQTKDERTPWHHKIGRRLWDVFAGYGYRLRYTAAWMAGFVLAGAVFFGIAAHYGQIVPHQPPILSSAEYQAERAKGLSPMESAQAAFPKEYPEFSPLAYSLDVFIPFFALHQEPFWSPASGGDSDLWKASLLLALLAAAALALGGLASLLANWIRRECGDDFAGAGAAGVGMAAVLLLLGVGFAAGFAHAWLDFDLVAWLADWRWLTVWHWLEIGAGWVLTSLFLLSITGLLRPRQSSGEKG